MIFRPRKAGAGRHAQHALPAQTYHRLHRPEAQRETVTRLATEDLEVWTTVFGRDSLAGLWRRVQGPTGAAVLCADL